MRETKNLLKKKHWNEKKSIEKTSDFRMQCKLEKRLSTDSPGQCEPSFLSFSRVVSITSKNKQILCGNCALLSLSLSAVPHECKTMDDVFLMANLNQFRCFCHPTSLARSLARSLANVCMNILYIRVPAFVHMTPVPFISYIIPCDHTYFSPFWNVAVLLATFISHREGWTAIAWICANILMSKPLYGRCHFQYSFFQPK